MAGGKHRGIGWNPFKRPSRRKQKLQEGDALGNAGYIQQLGSEESSKEDEFSVSSSKKEDLCCSSSSLAVDPLKTMASNSSTPKETTSYFDASFDSSFATPVNTNEDFEKKKSGGCNTQEGQELIIYPPPQAFSPNATDLVPAFSSSTNDFEDFDAACFEPIYSPKVAFLQGVAQNKMRAELEDDEDDIFGNPASSSEYQSPVNQAGDHNEFFSETIENFGECENINAKVAMSNEDLTIHGKKKSPNTQSKIQAEEETQKKILEGSPSRANQYRNRIYEKTRNSRPFRNRLRNVLAAKSPSHNVTQQHSSPMAFAVRRHHSPPAFLDRSLHSHSPKMGSPYSKLANSRPTATTPRSQQLWAETKTPDRTKKAISASENLHSPLSANKNGSILADNVNQDEIMANAPSLFQKGGQNTESQYISPHSTDKEDKENDSIEIASDKALTYAVNNTSNTSARTSMSKESPKPEGNTPLSVQPEDAQQGLVVASTVTSDESVVSESVLETKVDYVYHTANVEQAEPLQPDYNGPPAPPPPPKSPQQQQSKDSAEKRASPFKPKCNLTADEAVVASTVDNDKHKSETGTCKARVESKESVLVKALSIDSGHNTFEMERELSGSVSHVDEVKSDDLKSFAALTTKSDLFAALKSENSGTENTDSLDISSFEKTSFNGSFPSVSDKHDSETGTIGVHVESKESDLFEALNTDSASNTPDMEKELSGSVSHIDEVKSNDLKSFAALTTESDLFAALKTENSGTENTDSLAISSFEKTSFNGSFPSVSDKHDSETGTIEAHVESKESDLFEALNTDSASNTPDMEKELSGSVSHIDEVKSNDLKSFAALTTESDLFAVLKTENSGTENIGSLDLSSFEKASFYGSFPSVSEHQTTGFEFGDTQQQTPTIRGEHDNASIGLALVETEAIVETKDEQKDVQNSSCASRKSFTIRNEPSPRKPSSAAIDADEEASELPAAIIKNFSAEEAVVEEAEPEKATEPTVWVKTLAVDEVGQVEMEMAFVPQTKTLSSTEVLENDPPPCKLRLPDIPKPAKKHFDAERGEHQSSYSFCSRPFAKGPSGAADVEQAPDSFATPRTNYATRGGASPASQRRRDILSLLGNPGVEVKSPQIGDVIEADLIVTVGSSISVSSGSDGSSSGSSYSSDDSDCSDNSGASELAILAISESGLQQASALGHSQSLLGHQSSGTRSDGTSYLRASSSDSDEDVFSKIDETLSADEARQEFFQQTATAGFSLESRSLPGTPTEASVSHVSSRDDSSYSDSHTEMTFGEVDASLQTAQKWYDKMKCAVFGQNIIYREGNKRRPTEQKNQKDDHGGGDGDDDDDRSDMLSTIDNGIQCEYTGVLGRLKFDMK